MKKGILLKPWKGVAAGQTVQVSPSIFRQLVENGFIEDPENPMPKELKKKTSSVKTTVDVIDEP